MKQFGDSIATCNYANWLVGIKVMPPQEDQSYDVMH